MEPNATYAVLLATMRPPARAATGFTVVQAGGEAAALWRSKRHRTVLADFGALADGMTGVKLARTLRALSATTRICLLSDNPRPDQIQWARSQGANEVVSRRFETAAERVLFCAPPWFTQRPVAAESVESACRRVGAALNEAGLGPASALAVDDALRRRRQHDASAPVSAADLAAAVASNIDNPGARHVFLSKFGVQS
jgi:CheY-like chemotaxis protein